MITLEKFEELEFNNEEFREICRILIADERLDRVRVSQNIKNLALTLYKSDKNVMVTMLNPKKSFVRSTTKAYHPIHGEIKEDKEVKAGRSISVDTSNLKTANKAPDKPKDKKESKPLTDLEKVQQALEDKGISYDKRIKDAKKLAEKYL